MNRKRHTTRNRWISVCMLAFVGTLWLYACAAPKAIPVRDTLPAVPVKPTASPVIAEARSVSGKADIEAERARAALDRARDNLDRTQNDLRSVVAEADRLRKQKTASENELLDLYNRLVEQDKRTSLLVSDLSSLKEALASERQLRQAVSSRLSDAERLALAKEHEGDELRRQLESVKQLAENNFKAAEDADKARAVSQSKLDIEKGKSKVYFWTALVEFLLIAAWVIWSLLRSRMVRLATGL